MHGALFALLGAALFGLSNVLARLGIARSSVYVSVTWNIVTSLTVFSLIFAFNFVTRGAFNPGEFAWAALPFFAGAGLANDFLARLSMFSASAKLGASRATAFRVASPVITTGASFLLLGERLSAVAVGGITLILVGISVVTWDSLASHSRSNKRPAGANGAEAGEGEKAASFDVRKGLALGVLAAIFFGTGDILRKQGIAIEPSPLFGAAVSGSVGFLLYAGLGAVRGTWKDALRPGPALPYIVSGGAATGIAVICLLTSMQTLPVAVATTINGTQALFAILFGWWLDRAKENITWLLGAGALLTIFGLRLVLLG